MRREEGGPPRSQLELSVEREFQPDRNHDRGGRSFYFFDLDDNVFYLPTPMYIYHKNSGEEIEMSTGHFAQIAKEIGKSGYYKDFEVRFQDDSGSYRRFRDFGLDVESFEQDVLNVISESDYHWKGPSWSCFYHATFNQRPISIITARGHSPHTIRKGLHQFYQNRLIQHDPNYLGVFPVSNPEVREALGVDPNADVNIPDLKKRAIFKSVELAFQKYGQNPYHRFGMSDDDPRNLDLIRDAMTQLKQRYPKNSFFVISIHNDEMIKEEIAAPKTKSVSTEKSNEDDMKQLPLL
ncbi:MAG: hypothetical protein KDD25_02320 [Bdellovibrionales bacterium]|nr:hypothetical protein [Bdellovibrionales bacterium]